jgi:hypothetical protein
VIKLYVIHNVLEIADKLMSSFGQDVLDALFAKATSAETSRWKHIVLIMPHLSIAIIYACWYSCCRLVVNSALISVKTLQCTTIPMQCASITPYSGRQASRWVGRQIVLHFLSNHILTTSHWSCGISKLFDWTSCGQEFYSFR